MLQAYGLSITVDPKVGPLFENIDLTLDSGEKVALVGRNGAGKSLIVKILAGRIRPSKGRVVLNGGARLAYLPQDFDHGFEGSLLDLLERESPEAPWHAIARTLHRLGLDTALLHRRYGTLSLGERMRGALAAILASEPSILLLDEPTNHLDVATKEWLENFLRHSPEAVLLVCHDRSVVNAVADRVIELERGQLTSYTGNYEDMVAHKATRNARAKEEWENHRQEDRRLRVAAEEAAQLAAKMTKRPTSRTFMAGAKPFYAAKQARLDKRSKAILSRVSQAREDAPEKPFEADSISLEIPARPLRHEEALAARKLMKTYGDRVLFRDLNITLHRGSRVAVIGPNGAGKTTLFRILLGEEVADQGEVKWASDARIATLSQARDALDLSLPAIRALDPKDPDAEKLARTALARLGMRGDIADRPLEVLSVGERTKVEIVSMLLTGANVLMLDEPTNHLDLASVEALEAALATFPGAILFVSHDREFVNRLATEVIEM